MRGILAVLFLAAASAAAEPGAVRVAGPGAEPHLVFACELDAAALEALFSDPSIIAGVTDLKAGIALAVEDLDPRTAAIVRRLNAAGIPLTAWLALPKDQGYYMNAGNAPQSSARFAAFQGWTSRNRLRWAAVGLDIEPSLQEFSVLFQGSRWSLAAMLARRYFQFGRLARARQAYGELIRRIQAAGYPVETYQFLFLADERRVHTTLLERLFRLVDVRGNDEVLMLYSSFQHAAGSALVWKYGPEAQTIAVGSTAGDPGDRRFGPLDWQELSNDLIVAAHFTPVVGVFSLEGCVRQGFLPRLKTMDWSRTVVIPAASIARVERFRRGVQAVLWTVSRLPYFAAALLMAAIAWFAWRRRTRIRARLSPPFWR